MALRLKANRRFPSVPVVTDNTENHTQVLMAVKEALDIGQRRTGDLLNSFIRVEDLIDLGLITIEGNTNAIVGADLSEIANIGDLSGAAEGDFLRFDGDDWVNDQLALSDITQGMVTQHQAALALTASQITDLQGISPVWTGTHTWSIGPQYFRITAAQYAALAFDYSGEAAPVVGEPVVAQGSFINIGVGGAPTYVLGRANTSLAAPTAVVANQRIGQVRAMGYDGDELAMGGQFFFVPTETFSETNRGTRFQLDLVPTGSATISEAFRVTSNATGAAIAGLDGTVAQPYFGFRDDTDTGMYRSGANNFGFAAGGANVLDLFSSGTVFGGTFTQLDAVPDQPYVTTPLFVYSNPFIAGYASQYAFFSTRYGTSLTAPTAVGSGLTLGGFSGNGYDGTATGRGAFFFMLSTEAWTTTNHGAGFEFRATPIGSNTDGGITANRILQLAINSTSGYARGADGALSQPFYSFFNDSDTGLYRVTGNSLGVSAGGVGVAQFTLSGTTRVAQVGDGTNAAQLIVSGAAAASRDVAWQSGSTSRWIARTNTTAESGSNAGSDFEFNARDDAGNALLSAWIAVRSTGQMRFRDGTNALPSISFQSDTDTGLFSQAANALGVSANGVEVARFDSNSTAGNTRFMIYDVDNGTLERVSVGPADSGQAGFKLLRIPN